MGHIAHQPTTSTTERRTSFDPIQHKMPTRQHSEVAANLAAGSHVLDVARRDGRPTLTVAGLGREDAVIAATGTSPTTQRR